LSAASITAIGNEAGEATAKAIAKQLEDIAAEKAKAQALAKTKVNNNVYRDSSLADPYKPVYSATGPWKPAAMLTPDEANKLVERSLPATVRLLNEEDTDVLNAKVLMDQPEFSPPYLPRSKALTVITSESSKFVRVYVPFQTSIQAAKWMMPESEIIGLTPEQIASKFALPQVPTHISDVRIPQGHLMRVTIVNDINIFPKSSIGGNGGGGGVQFEVLIDHPPESTWFSNERKLR
jgi:filamentous hemagglutinin